jgi:hypothetical protein
MKADMRLTISNRMDDTWLRIRPVPGGEYPVTIKEAGYGYVIEPDHREWAMVTQATSRQDGQTSWLVTLTDVDGVARVESGLCKTSSAAVTIAGAIIGITFKARWVNPAYVEVVE